MELFKAERFQGGPWLMRAQKVTYDTKRHLYLGEGQVELRQGERRITANKAEVNDVTKVAWLQGNVVVVMEEDVFTGQEGNFNLATRSGELTGARLFLKRNHFHVDAPLIRRTSETSYYAEKAVVTTCDADKPIWSFFTGQLNVVLEGYATGKDTYARLAGVPVLYLPWSVMPVMTDRASGFLMPLVSQQKAGGSVIEAPFYWAINNYSDLTLYQTGMSSRGYMQGAEYRYRGYADSARTLRIFYLDDDTRNPSQGRYWVSGMVDEHLGGGWDLRGVLDRVSDRNYLHDFNFGYMGLNRYNHDVFMEYGRTLEAQDVDTRVSSLLLANNYPWANLTAYSRYYEKLRPSDPAPFQRLPGVNLTSVPLPLGNFPLMAGIESSYTYFAQDRRAGWRGDRLDLHPQLWWVNQPLPGVALSSRFGLRETIFRVDHTLPGEPQQDYLTRQLYDAKVSLSSSLMKDYGRDSSDSTSFWRHIMRPEVTYWNMPNYDGHRFPPFDAFDQGWVLRPNRNLPIRDGDDPLGGVNAVTYGISNNILRRSTNEQGQATVKDLIWFRLSQSVFFNSSSMALDGTREPHHRISDFYGEMELYPVKPVTLGLSLGASPEKEGFNRADVKFVFMDPKRQDYLSVDYIYIKDFAQQINVATYLNLLQSVKSWLTYSHTFNTDKKMEQRYGLVLQRQCWGCVISYTDRPDDKRVGFSIYLPGMGERLKRSPVRFPSEDKKGKEAPDIF